MPEKEEIECYTGERETNIPFQDECRQCVFEALCLSWNSKQQGDENTHEVEKTS